MRFESKHNIKKSLTIAHLVTYGFTFIIVALFTVMVKSLGIQGRVGMLFGVILFSLLAWYTTKSLRSTVLELEIQPIKFIFIAGGEKIEAERISCLIWEEKRRVPRGEDESVIVIEHWEKRYNISNRHFSQADFEQIRDALIQEDSDYDTNASEKPDILNKIGYIGATLGVVGYFAPAIIGMIIMPALIVYPAITIFRMNRFASVLEKYPKRKNEYQMVLLNGVFIPALALFLVLRKNINLFVTNWLDHWLLICIGFLLYLFFFLPFTVDNKLFKNSLVWVIIFCLLLGTTASVAVNWLFDGSQPDFYRTIVQTKYSSRTKTSTTYRIAVHPFLFKSLRVDKKIFDKVSKGDQIDIPVYGGCFGMPWCKISLD